MTDSIGNGRVSSDIFLPLSFYLNAIHVIVLLGNALFLSEAIHTAVFP